MSRRLARRRPRVTHGSEGISHVGRLVTRRGVWEFTDSVRRPTEAGGGREVGWRAGGRQEEPVGMGRHLITSDGRRQEELLKCLVFATLIYIYR